MLDLSSKKELELSLFFDIVERILKNSEDKITETQIFFALVKKRFYIFILELIVVDPARTL